ncbi:MAG: NADH-quinone oxidoreductase subunit NuoH [Chloroflexi bacterium]|nr:NADH-quinone oxidoreductase subunit NuoH [Chloroflexota bacterium]
MTWLDALRLLISLLLTLGFLIASVLILIYIERKVAAFIQDRLGPYHTGKWGILQSIADALKLFLKEDIVPEQADRLVFTLAPVIFFAPVLGAFVVLPFAESLVAADLQIGVLYVIALGTFGVLGVIAAGWGSNNKYSVLGAFRSAAQLISYEIPMILATMGVIMISGSLSLSSIVLAQQPYWYILLQPLGFFVFLICGLAETNRNPFDLPEAESELVAGFLTEFSGIRWALFFLGEYGNMIIVSAMAAVLFLGGWQGPVLPGILWFLLKVYFLLLVFIWFRATFPRLRADQLMSFSWKVLIPITLANIALTGLMLLLFPGNLLLPAGVVNWLVLVGILLSSPAIFKRAVSVRRLV